MDRVPNAKEKVLTLPFELNGDAHAHERRLALTGAGHATTNEINTADAGDTKIP
jgi:hypothetical protein